MQIEAQLESFEMYMVALDTTLLISRHKAPNMPYIQSTHGATSIEDSTPFLPTYDSKKNIKKKEQIIF